MSTHSLRALVMIALCAMASSGAHADAPATAPRLGTPITAEEAAKWDLTIFPDGRGLPPGYGTAVEGRVLFDKHCASCHGAGGRGATAEELVGEPVPPTAENPSKAIGPYAACSTRITLRR
jgi:S-disulfanyl-L-cysteine oxidoreductase SoxD